ncbi:MFS transporter [Sinisalibacter lacisalsi]|uniref:MFS transporter n=1 Tax=Sinisalibacter lacisalsi TaxID=1526570 RepID=A0ABQ1QR02_9RHOB|nr:MFS transporter [Sinisalibacter lacisalsi]GGD39975.1 MFS transporter [Sinisalibacter lacisalsi]
MLAFLRQNAPFLAAGTLLTFLSSFGQTFFIAVFSGEIREAFSLSHGQWGGIYMLGTMASAAVMVWAGGLTDRFRVRVLGPVMLLGLAAAMIALAFTPWVWALAVVIFALRFFGQGMLGHVAVVAMARWFVKTRGRALSIASLGVALGEASLPLLFAALLTMADWRTLWLGAALVPALGVLVMLWLLGKERTPQSHAESDVSFGMGARHWTRGEALRGPLFWLMLPAILGPAAFNTAFFFHQVHLAEVKGLAHVQLVALFPLYTGLAITAMLVTGWALDRLGTARLMPLSQLPVALAFVIFSLAEGQGGMFVGLVFLALTSGANATLPNAFWAEFYGTAHIGAIKALAAAAMVLGSAIGPGLTGLLIDLGIGIERQFIGVAGYFLFATLLMRLGIRRATRRF